MRRLEYRMVAIVLIGLLLRLAVAPYSAGTDLAQFYGFGGTMLKEGACFYLHADASGFLEKGWPYPWPYVYGPVMAYIFAVLRGIVGGQVKTFWSDGDYYVYIDPTWAFSLKLIFILADTIVALLIYLLLKDKDQRFAVYGSALYYLNPMTIYVSAIYGMFDGLALAVFLLGLYLSRKERLSYALYGFSLALKHTLAFPAMISVWDTILRGKRTATRIAFFLIGGALPFAPMLLPCPSSLGEMLRLMKGLETSYPLPLSYSMNGVSSLATYIHLVGGRETIFLLQHWYVPAFILLSLIFIRHSFRLELLSSLSLSYAAFIATYWRVNPQYLVPLVAFLVILASAERGVVRRLSIVGAVYVGMWPVIQPSAFWFHAHMEHPNWTLVHIMESITLGVSSNLVYVAYSLGLTVLLYTIILISTIPTLKNLKAWISEGRGVRA